MLQRHGGPGGNRGAEAEAHGVETGHGRNAAREFALHQPRQQHIGDANADGGQGLAGEERGAEMDAAQQHAEDLEHQHRQQRPLPPEPAGEGRRQGAEEPEAERGIVVNRLASAP
jgi:hypothetical protein